MGMSTFSFLVPGMTCGHCTSAVESEIRKINGVQDVKIDLDSKVVEVSGDPLEWDQLKAAVDEAGYELVVK